MGAQRDTTVINPRPNASPSKLKFYEDLRDVCVYLDALNDEKSCSGIFIKFNKGGIQGVGPAVVTMRNDPRFEEIRRSST